MSALRKRAIIRGVGAVVDLGGNGRERRAPRRTRMDDVDRLNRDLAKVTGDFSRAYVQLVDELERR